ncbi:MAG TPA: OsmC family protein [Candidatus Desulfaltia sp.]|nr:OsmC family protein [Candidatus Desulfaltia sp.]
MSEDDRSFSVKLKRLEGFRFEVDFGIGSPSLVMDEPAPVGENMGPNASKVLAAAMGNCLTASLLFCLEKARAEVGGIETRVSGVMRRNEQGRWRIAGVDVEIIPEIPAEFQKQFERCSGLFEDFCIVSKSIEQGIPINVKVSPR